MPLSASQGYKIREEYSDIKEKKICDAHGLKQIGGSRTKIDGSDGISNKSIKNASGSSTQVHLTTQKHFCEILELDENSIKFIELFCGNATIDNGGKDRYHTNEIDVKYLAEFNTFLEKNKLKVIDLIIRNGFNITHVVYNDIKNNIEYELTYEEIIAKIKDAEWEFKRGGIHLKLGKKSLFHFQREGKKKPSNRYNVLWHIHRNLFVC
tara:strand:- start:887 stop:1513 length:627 start_codon:yes stop_codon:yes gene_type:complete